MSDAAVSTYLTKLLLGGPLCAGALPRNDPEMVAQIAAIWAGGWPTIAAAWREHEDFLKREAVRLKIRPAWNGAFFAQRIAAAMSPRKENT